LAPLISCKLSLIATKFPTRSQINKETTLYATYLHNLQAS